VSCPGDAGGATQACDGSGPRPTAKEACHSETECGWCPFGTAALASCSLQRSLLLIMTPALLALGCCILCFMKRLRRRHTAKVDEPAVFLSVAPPGPTDKTVETGDSTSTTDDISHIQTMHCMQTSTTDDISHIQTMHCMHCIGEPPGCWEVVPGEHAEMAGDHDGYSEPPTQTQAPNARIAALDVEEIDMYADNYDTFASSIASSRESSASAYMEPSGRGNAAYMEPSRLGHDAEDDGGQVAEVVASCGGRCGAPSMMLAVCRDVSGTRVIQAADDEWERAMQAIERTSQQVSQLTAEGRTAPRSQRLEIHKRVRALESSPDYIWALRHLEQSHQSLSAGNAVDVDWREGMTVKL